jgi:hypothetical protein
MKKNEYTYPGSDLDRSKVLISLLGSFWARTYTGIDQIHSHVDATAYTVAQSHRNLLEAVAALSRYDVPLFHEELLYPVVLRRSELNTALTNTVAFDREKNRFDGDLLFDTAVDNELFSFPLPAQFVGAENLFNKLTFPTVSLAADIDFTVDRARNALVFVSNPFDNPGVLKRAITNADGTQDEELTLWAFCGKFDYEYVFTQFAYALGIKLQTSQNYKDLTNAIFSGLIDGGLSAKNLDTAISANCGIPLVMEPQEVVEVVEYDAAGLLIVTDKNVYKFHEDAIPAVAVGQTVRAGDYLVRGFEVNEFFVGNTYLRDNEDPVDRPETTKLLATNIYETIAAENDDELLVAVESTCPPKKDLAALALDNSFLSTCFYGDLVFENKVVPLLVDDNHPTGYTFVSFELGGFPADIERFFQEVHARGIEAAETNRIACFLNPNEYRSFADLPEKGIVGKIYKTLDDNRYYDWVPAETEIEESRYVQITQVPPFKKLGTLAHLLDKRKQPEGEPSADNLPREINPLRFIVENVLRNNVFVVRINVSALGQNRLGLYNIRHLRQVLPPQTAMIVVFELTLKSDRINADEYVPDTLITFTGLEPQLDTVDETYVKDLGVLINRISGTCQ